MPPESYVTAGLAGTYHDVLRDERGRVIWDSGPRRNTILTNFRRLLAALMRQTANSLGIQSLNVGAGDPSWDIAPPGPTDPSRTALVDLNPATVPLGAAQFAFLQPDSDAVAPGPTNRLRIQASLGPGLPAWPDANHVTATLREFGLVANLAGSPVLINYVVHPAIVKDPTSTLERTIWLVF